MSDKRVRKYLQVGTMECMLLCMGVALLIGIGFFTLGFWRTLLLAVLLLIGMFIGGVTNKREMMSDLSNKLFPARAQQAAKAAPAPAAKPQETAHHAEPLAAHMHVPEMGVEGEGTEGIDCCHEYMLDQTPREEPSELLFPADETEQERAAALLQGVIFSEILGRRAHKGFGGRRA